MKRYELKTLEVQEALDKLSNLLRETTHFLKELAQETQTLKETTAGMVIGEIPTATLDKLSQIQINDLRERARQLHEKVSSLKLQVVEEWIDPFEELIKDSQEETAQDDGEEDLYALV